MNDNLGEISIMDNNWISHIKASLFEKATKVPDSLRLAALILCLVVYVLFFKSLNRIAGDGAFALMPIFPILAGSMLGTRYGIIFGIFISMTGFFMGLGVGYGFQDAIRISTMVIFTNVFIGFTVGRLKELNMKVKKEFAERIRAEEALSEGGEVLIDPGNRGVH